VLGFIAVVCVVVAVMGGLVAMSLSNRQAAAKATAERRESLELGLVWLLTKHDKALRQQIRQKLYTDAYGRLMLDKVPPVTTYFMRTVVFETLQPKNEQECDLLVGGFSNWCDNLDFEALLREPWSDAETSDGLTYERRVGALLTNAGFDVRFTPASGDQGVDLLAERGGERVAIQCKHYAAAAGNDAVQQVYAGARFYGAQRAAVVAPNGYTVAARQLAESLGVVCLHHDDVAATLGTPLAFGVAGAA